MVVIKKGLLRVLIYSLVSLAVLMTALRLCLLWIFEHPTVIEKYLSQKLDAAVSIHSMAMDWDKTSLNLMFHNVQIEQSDHTPMARLKQIALVIDLADTVKHFRWQVVRLFGEELEWTLQGSPESRLFEWDKWSSLIEWFSHQPHWVFKNIRVAWHPTPTDAPITFFIPQVGRDKQAEYSQLSGSLYIEEREAPKGHLDWSARFTNASQSDFFIQGDSLSLLHLGTLFPLPFTVKTGTTEFKLWGKAHSEEGLQVTSALSFQNLSLLGKNQENVTIPHSEIDFLLHIPNKKEWTLKAKHRPFEINQAKWPEGSFEIQKTLQEKKPHFLFAADYLDFKAITTLLPLFPKKWIPSTLFQFVQEGKPSGVVQGLSLSFSNCHTPELIAAQFQDLSLSPFRDWPGFTGITGSIWHEHDKGVLNIHNRDLTLHFPNWFRGPFSFSQVNGKTTWHKNDKTWIVQTPFLGLKNRDLELAAQFQLTLPPKNGHPELALVASFMNVDGSHHARYLPVHLMDESLVRWLEASIKKTHIPKGALVFRGPLSEFPFSHHSGVFEVVGNLQDLILHYDPAWPPIHNGQGELRFTGQGMQVSLQKGEIINTAIQKVHATIPNFLLDNPWLSIESHVKGDSKNGITFLRQYLLPDRIDLLNLQGPFELALELKIPLGEETTPVQVKGKVDLSENQLSVQKAPFSLDHLNGALYFTADEIKSEALSGILLEEPVTLTLAMLPHKKNILEATLNGALDPKALSQHFLFQKLEGKAAYQAHFQFKDTASERKAVSTRFSIYSDLKGLALHLPSPLAKSETEEGRFELEGQLSQNKSTLSLKAKINERTPAFSLKASLTPSKNILKTSIQGNFPSIDIGEWIDFFPDKQFKSPAFEHTFEVRDLFFEDIKLGNRVFPAVHVGVFPSKTQWAFSFQSPDLMGSMEIPVKSPEELPIQFKFKHLHLPIPRKDLIAKAPSSKIKVNSSRIPKLNGDIDEFIYEGKEIGSIHLTTQPTVGGVLFQSTLNRKELSSTLLDGFWTEREGRAHTQLKGKHHSKNLAQDLKVWNLETGIEESEADLTFNWEWKGNPTDSDIEKIRGDMTVSLKNGRLVDVSMGPSRILGILSIQALKRRLMLDFKDLYQKGLAFDTLKGTFRLIEGNAYTCDTVLVGPSTHISLQGRTGFVTRDYHQVAYVALDLTGSLPFIVGAFNPIAGAATWVGNKLLEEQVNKLTRFQYTMTGPWDNPNITVTKAPLLFKPWEIIPELLPPFLKDNKKKDPVGSLWCVPS